MSNPDRDDLPSKPQPYSQDIYFLEPSTYRNRPGRSGLDPMDSYREMWYVIGRSLRGVFQRQFRDRNLFYQVLIALIMLVMTFNFAWGQISTFQFLTTQRTVSQITPMTGTFGKLSSGKIVNQSVHQITIEVGYSYDLIQGDKPLISACLLSSNGKGGQLSSSVCAKSSALETPKSTITLTIHPTLPSPQVFSAIFISLEETNGNALDVLTLPISYEWQP